MIITIDKKYVFPDSWADITLSKASEIFELPVPPKLKEYWKAKMNNKTLSTLTERDLVKTFPEYYGQMLNIFGVPHTVVKKIQYMDRTAFFNTYLLEYVLGVHYSPNYTPTKPEYIDYGEKLYFPKSKEVLGQEIPMAFATAWEFSEMADLNIYSKDLANGKYGVLANIASIMCRPIEEEYDEDVSLKRAETLKDMKMSDAWEVFFCLMEQLNLQLRHDQTYLQGVLTQRLKLPLNKRALVRGTILLSKWGKRFKGLKT